MKNYYKVLGIEKTASEGEIKKAYAVMVRKFPPEKEGEKFGEISEAYSTLSNKIKRTEYDKENGFDEVSQELLDGAKEFKHSLLLLIVVLSSADLESITLLSSKKQKGHFICAPPFLFITFYLIKLLYILMCVFSSVYLKYY